MSPQKQQFPLTASERLKQRVDRLQGAALAAGLVALALTAVGFFTNRQQFFFSYLFAFLFWLGLSLGCFVVTMIHELAGGRWGYPTRRFLEAGFMVLPLMAVLCVPVLLGLRELYPWARPFDAAAEKVLAHRQPYQNAWAYLLRMALFLGISFWIANALRKWSLRQDATTDPGPTRKARTLSGPGIVVFGLLGTFAYVDWIMSLEREWYSTMFPVIVFIGQILVAYSFSVLMLGLFKNDPPLSGVVTRTHYHHLGNLLLTFVLFWTYVSFGQFLIIYSGDLPHELKWYLHRIAGSWKGVVSSLALFHFFIPFFLLLFRATKKHVASLMTLAGLLFVAHLVDAYWLVMPALHHDGVHVSWMDLTAPVGIGGLWLACFAARLKAAPLLPQNDPGLQFAFRYGH